MVAVGLGSVGVAGAVALGTAVAIVAGRGVADGGAGLAAIGSPSAAPAARDGTQAASRAVSIRQAAQHNL